MLHTHYITKTVRSIDALIEPVPVVMLLNAILLIDRITAKSYNIPVYKESWHDLLMMATPLHVLIFVVALSGVYLILYPVLAGAIE